MKPLPSLLLAAGVGFAGTAGALAAGEQIHQMTIKLPAGGIAHITYTGDKAPKVTVDQKPSRLTAFQADPAFAIFARMQADMDRQMRAMQALFNDPALRPELDTAILHGTSDNANDVFNISTAKNRGFCLQSVQITQSGNEKPKVVRRTAGNCGPARSGSDASVSDPGTHADVANISYR